jgi:hypothetical protein
MKNFITELLGTTAKDRLTNIAGLILLVSATLEAIGKENTISLESVARVLAALAGSIVGFATGKTSDLNHSAR